MVRVSSEKVLAVLKNCMTPGRPFHAQWFLTRRCNYRCRSCNVWRDRTWEGEVSTDEVLRGLDALHKLGVMEIVFSGGNPLLREDIGEIVDYASRLFITTIYDNGSMAAKKIEAVRNADFVAISMDSLDEKKNDYLRGVSGATRTAIASIRALKESGISVSVAPTISNANIHEMVEFTRFFIDRGIPVWYAVYAYDSPVNSRLFGIGRRSDEFEFSNCLTMAQFCTILLEMKKKHKGIFITRKTLVALRKLYSEGTRIWMCHALRSFLMVDHHGRVSGCHYYPPITSITEVVDAWKSPELERARQFYSGCTKCTYLCYIFYSLYSDIRGNIEILLDQAQNISMLRLR